MLFPDAKPNAAAHRALAVGEADGRLKAVITQNIDGLHQMAREPGGAGAARQRPPATTAPAAGNFTALDDVDHARVPLCDCGGTVKPDVVLYEGKGWTAIRWKSPSATSARRTC